MQLRSCANHAVTSRTMFSSGLGRSLSPGEGWQEVWYSEDPAAGWAPAHRVGRCQPCGCDAASAPETREHTGSHSQPSSAKFLPATGAEISGAQWGENVKTTSQVGNKTPRGDKSQEGGFPGDRGGGLFTGKGTRAFSGGCKVNTWMKSHCHLADLSVCAFTWLQLHLHEQQYCPKCRWR